MDTTNSLLDRVAAKHGNCSDYRLAKILQVVHGSISNYRAGRSHVSDEIALRVASELDLAPGYVLACMAAERAQTEELRRTWAGVARVMTKARRAAAAVSLWLVIPGVMALGVAREIARVSYCILS